MSKVFVLAETEQAARELCAGARTFGDTVVLANVGVPAVLGVADKVLHIDVPADNVVDDAYVALNRAFDAEEAQVVLAEPTVHVLSLVGRLAAHVGAAAITGATSFADDVASSMYFGGTGTRGARPTSEVKVYTIAPGTFDAAEARGTDAVEEVAFEAPVRAVKRIAFEPREASSVDLGAADAVVACGRGFQSHDDLQLAYDLAAKLGAEVGCSRPLAEGEGWFPREAYIGVSGQFVSPRVYVAAGVSGQMQHMVGCTGAGIVVAVNKDKNAPVFDQCDYGIAGDIKTVLPVLTAVL